MLSALLPRTRRPLRAIAWGAGSLASIILAQRVLDAADGAQPLPSLVYVLPVAVAAWRGGMVPGAVMTALAVGAAAMLPEGRPGWAWTDPVHSLRMVVLVIVALLVSALFQSLWVARGRMESKQGELQDSGAFHEAISELTSDFAFSALIASDGSVRVDDVTDGFSRLFGYARSEMVGSSAWQKLIHPEDMPLVEAHVGALAQGESVRGRLRCIDQAGVTTWVEYLARPLQRPGEDGIRVFGAARNINEALRAEAAIREGEERLQLALRAARMMAWSWNMDTGAMTRSDGTIAGTAEGSQAEFLQHVHEEDRARVGAAIDRVIAEGGEFEEEYRLTTSDGRLIHVIDRATIRRDPATGHRMMAGVLMDDTERRQVEEERRLNERLFKTLGESIDFGIWVCDSGGRNVYVSDSFLKLTGMTQQEFSDPEWKRILHPEDAERTSDAWQECVRRQGSWDAEYRVLGADGRYHPILARGVPARDDAGRATHWVGIHLDVSRLKDVELALQEADRRKDEFLATLAHELRNPLAPIRNALHSLSLSDAPEIRARALGILERQVGQTVRLVDDLLDVSRITSGKLELRPEPVRLREIAESALEIAGPRLQDAGLAVRLELPERDVLLVADRGRMAQVIGNLLNNAAKFTPPGGHVALSAAREAGEIRICVADDGAGIAPELLPRIFDMFVQAETSVGRARGGLGVGLAIVRRIAELHGGRVEAESDGPGRGCRISVVLPAAPAGTEVHAAMAPKAESAVRRRILVADDNADSVASLRVMLELMGHEVMTAESGEEALEALSRHRPDVVLLDIGMPGMDGYETARRMGGMPERSACTVVALTGWGQDADKKRSAEAGFDAHFVKPVDLALLKQLLADRTPQASP